MNRTRIAPVGSNPVLACEIIKGASVEITNTIAIYFLQQTSGYLGNITSGYATASIRESSYRIH
jgi:hypothetical protein